MSKRGGIKKPNGPPGPCRAIDYSQMVTGTRLTDAAIERYLAEGKYGKAKQEAFLKQQQEQEQKSKQKRTRTCNTLQKLIQFFTDSPSDSSENTNR